MPAKCPQCKSPKGHTDSYYCSPECVAESKRDARRRYKAKKRATAKATEPPRLCAVCDQAIENPKGRQRYCSEDCFKESERRRVSAFRASSPDYRKRCSQISAAQARAKRLAAGHPPCIDCGCEIPAEVTLKKVRCDPCRKELKRVRDRAQSKKYAAANKEKVRAKDVAYRAKNAARINEYCKEWRKNNRDIVVAQNARRRQREAAAATGERCDPLEVYIQGGGICYLCGYPIDWFGNMYEPLSFNVEHLVPISLGGRHEMANVGPAHRVCNMRKGSKLVEDLDLPFPRPW